MLSRAEGTFGLLKRIKDLDYSNIPDRLYTQKTGYTLRKGYDDNFLPGYRFNWWVYGPYSTGLAKDFYKVEHTDNVKELSFRSNEKEKAFEEAIDFFQKVDSDEEIELVGYLVYATKELNRVGSDAKEWISKNKPWFNNKKIENMQNILEEHEVIKT